MAGLLLVGGTGFAQEKTAVVPDAEIEANVLKALADVPQLADQSISTTTVYGEVTLSGTVKDEASRDMAEKVAADAPGVKKVVDQLAIGTVAAAESIRSRAGSGTGSRGERSGITVRWNLCSGASTAQPDAQQNPEEGDANAEAGPHPPQQGPNRPEWTVSAALRTSVWSAAS